MRSRDRNQDGRYIWTPSVQSLVPKSYEDAERQEIASLVPLLVEIPEHTQAMDGVNLVTAGCFGGPQTEVSKRKQEDQLDTRLKAILL